MNEEERMDTLERIAQWAHEQAEKCMEQSFRESDETVFGMSMEQVLDSMELQMMGIKP